MINTIKTSTALGDPNEDRRPPRQDGETEAQPAPASATPNPQADIRLVIEQDAAGGLIYKRIDRATGEVISEVSREDLMRMSADPAYTAGAMISTKA